MSEGYGSPFSSFGMGPGYGTRFEDMNDPQKQFYEQNPGAGYMNELTQQGMGGADRRATWAQGQQGRIYNQFLAQLANNTLGRAQAGDPNTFWSGYLQNHANDLSTQFNQLGPADRGDANMQAPRLRWLMSAI